MRPRKLSCDNQAGFHSLSPVSGEHVDPVQCILYLIGHFRLSPDTVAQFCCLLRRSVSMFREYECPDRDLLADLFFLQGMCAAEVPLIYVRNFQMWIRLKPDHKDDEALCGTFSDLFHRSNSRLAVTRGVNLAHIAATAGNINFLRMWIRTGGETVGQAVQCMEQDWTRCVNCLFSSLGINSSVIRPEMEVESYEKPRLALILRSMEIFTSIRRNYFFADRYATCFRAIMDASKERFVTKDEFNSSLRKILKGFADEQLISDLCLEFECYFPEVNSPPAPKPLMHLTRCQIRSNLLESGGNVRCSVASLRLPKLLKEYVLCEDELSNLDF